jgi:hypothetical protein
LKKKKKNAAERNETTNKKAGIFIFFRDCIYRQYIFLSDVEGLVYADDNDTSQKRGKRREWVSKVHGEFNYFYVVVRSNRSSI